MDNVAHVEDDKKELVRDVHRSNRMGVRFVDSNKEAHSSQYSIHSGATKMYHDVHEVYWSNQMKNDIAEFVAKCLNCQQVKVEHQKPGGLAQNICFPAWKWKYLNMDYIQAYLTLDDSLIQFGLLWTE
ncbi:hypothetical protein MTR67_035232 [Solanum verrucosum]|uniref:Integrase zinc-binding domain-containing protein n=1 Tax=Solanum verrucosum TaxID=315347 RepID=A0AAF0U9L9_SOLVR|nr:hypothetical protein MTR67_035232 [Solanum verrucosum]